jgi:hypothetical protein
MRSWTPRLAGAVLVAGLHLPVIVALLTMNLAGDTRPFAIAPETMIVLPLVPKPARLPVQGPVRSGAAGVTVPSDLKLPFAVPPAANAPSLGLGLFACAPENLKNLSREDRDKCLKLAGGRYVAMKDGLPLYVKPPGPEWEGLRNSDIQARERNTADPCAIAKMGKMAGAECYHEVIYGKGLW